MSPGPDFVVRRPPWLGEPVGQCLGHAVAVGQLAAHSDDCDAWELFVDSPSGPVFPAETETGCPAGGDSALSSPTTLGPDDAGFP